MTSASWRPLDIDSPDATAVGKPDSGTHVVAFVATDAVRESGWSARAALEICRGWAADGARVVLCDVSLEAPELHGVAGLDNLEGVSDALLFGTSFQRIGQPVSDGLYLATAGTAVPDGAALRSHSRWRDFAGAFAQAGAVLALYLPGDAGGVEPLTVLADGFVVLRAEGEEAVTALPAGSAVLAEVGPASAQVGAPGEEDPSVQHPTEALPAASASAAVAGDDPVSDPEPEPEEVIETLTFEELGIEPPSPDLPVGIGNALADLDLEDSSPEIAFPEGPTLVEEGREEEIVRSLVDDKAALEELAEEFDETDLSFEALRGEVEEVPAVAEETESFGGLDVDPPRSGEGAADPEDGAGAFAVGEQVEEGTANDEGTGGEDDVEEVEGVAAVEVVPADEDFDRDGDLGRPEGVGPIDAKATSDEVVDLADHMREEDPLFASEPGLVPDDDVLLVPVDGVEEESLDSGIRHDQPLADVDREFTAVEPAFVSDAGDAVDPFAVAFEPDTPPLAASRSRMPPRRTLTPTSGTFSGSSRVRLVTLLLLLIVLALLVAEWMGIVSIPGLTPAEDSDPLASYVLSYTAPTALNFTLPERRGVQPE